MEKNIPNKEVLLNQLKIEWQDHIQTRNQTWRTLQIEVFLLLCLIAVDLKFDNKWVTLMFGIVIIISNLLGVRITAHHRQAQVRKFTHIDRLEESLGLHSPGLLDEVHPPPKFKWTDVISPLKTNTPLFILRMHIAILTLTVLYIIVNFIN